MNNYIKLLVLALLILASNACHKDSLSEGTGETELPNVDVSGTVTGDVLGYVYDASNSPVFGAAVSMLGETSASDEYGVFSFKNVELDPNGTYLKVELDGYMLGSDMVYGLEGRSHTSRVFLHKIDGAESFASSEGGIINVEGGGRITFSANSIASENGSNYSGVVHVSAKRIAMDDPLVSDKMPGALVALDSEGRTVALGSMGMVAVELRDEEGNELNLREGSTAKVEFPIIQEQMNDAPGEIGLWSFDEVKGIWIEEGMASKTGSNFIGEVSHFSFWNCDAPFPLVNICGRIVFENGDPASQVQLRILAEGFGSAYGWTSDDGSFNGKVPKGELLKLQVFNFMCGFDDFITEIEVGPFENKTTIDDISIPSPSEYNFSGTVLCSGAPLANALVMYSYNDNTFVTEASEDGSFSIKIDQTCGAIGDVSIFAIDSDSGKASLTETVAADDNPTLSLEVCNDCAFSVSIEADSSGDICTERFIKANVQGSGNYDYLWSDGGTASTSQLLYTGTYCVTVTDVDAACSMVVCSEETFFSPLSVDISASSACGGEDGSIFYIFLGGVKPYTLEWSDPGITEQSDSIILDLPAGSYSVTATDANGCTVEASAIVEEGANFDVSLNAVNGCINASIEVDIVGGTAPFTYIWPQGVESNDNIGYVWGDGTYCIDVYDDNGCSQTACIDVVVENIFDQVILTVPNCSEGTYTFSNNSTVEVEASVFIGGEGYTLSQGQEVDINLIESGFRDYPASGFLPGSGCEFGQIWFYVPYMERDSSTQEATYTLTPRTCDTCDDAGVAFNDNYLAYATFNLANPGGIILIDSNYNDVTTEAASNMLSAGTYFAIITDSNTNCYIYSERIVVN